ncbi:hypothetical protein E3Q17_00274 [Wallemia mellicola]|uniref:Uncharacterized protein n=1 Tax=Wallemia mellicola TaxID=1708541 RepID=A0A4T0TWV5_9BASI|nr:hypothetical protein E3Q17_00274 [Wallemia mellicola]TIC69838.1 hypothetical protein E3Q02_00771 [Wallemia mellicola]
MSPSQKSTDVQCGELDRLRYVANIPYTSTLTMSSSNGVLGLDDLKSLSKRSKHSYDQIPVKDLRKFKNNKGLIKDTEEFLVLYKFHGPPSDDFEVFSLDDFNKVPYVRGKDIPADQCALAYLPIKVILPAGVTPTREIITFFQENEYIQLLQAHLAYHCILYFETTKVGWCRAGDWFCNICKMMSWAKRTYCHHTNLHKDDTPTVFVKKDIAICMPEVETGLAMGNRVFALSGSYLGMEVLDGKPGKGKAGAKNKKQSQRNSRHGGGSSRSSDSSTSTAPAIVSPPEVTQPQPQKPQLSITTFMSQSPSLNSISNSTSKPSTTFERASNVGVIGTRPRQKSDPASNIFNTPQVYKQSVVKATPLKHSANLPNRSPAFNYASVAHYPQQLHSRDLSRDLPKELSTDPPQLNATTYTSSNYPFADLSKYSPISDYKKHNGLFPSSSSNDGFSGPMLGLSLSSPDSSYLQQSSPESSHLMLSTSSVESSPIGREYQNNKIPRSSINSIDNYSIRSELALNNFMQALDRRNDHYIKQTGVFY